MSEIVRKDPAFQAISEETTESLRAWLGGPSFKVIYKASSCHTEPPSRLCVHLDVCCLLWPTDFPIVTQLANLHVSYCCSSSCHLDCGLRASGVSSLLSITSKDARGACTRSGLTFMWLKQCWYADGNATVFSAASSCLVSEQWWYCALMHAALVIRLPLSRL